MTCFLIFTILNVCYIFFLKYKLIPIISVAYNFNFKLFILKNYLFLFFLIIFSSRESDNVGLFHMKALKSEVLLVPWGREEKLWMESREEGRRDLWWAEEGTSQLIYSTSTADTPLELGWKQQPNRVGGVLLFGKQNFFCKITTFKLINMKEIQVYDFTIGRFW